MGTVSGMRRTASTNSIGAIIKDDFDKLIWNPQLDNNNEASLCVLLNNMKGKEVTRNKKFSWFEDIMSPDKTTTSTTGTGTTGAPLVLNDAITAYVPAGTILFIPRTGERILVESVTNTTTLVVTRDFGGYLSGAAALVSGDTVLVVGTAFAEGSVASDAITTTPTENYNYAQIFKTAVEFSGTLLETDLWAGGSDSSYQLKKAMFNHRKEINKSFWLGIRSITGTTVTTGGVMQIMAASGNGNVVDISSTGILTLKTLDSLSEMIFENGGSVRHVFGGMKLMSAISGITRGYVVIDNQSKESFGIAMKEIVTAHGTLRFVPESKVFAGAMAQEIIALDLSKLKYRYMQNRDTKLHKNIELPGQDSMKHEYLSQVGLEMTCYGIDNTAGIAYTDGNRSPHGRIKGFTTY